MANTFYIHFPGNITLGVELQDPHPVNLTVTFPSRGGGVKFSYSKEGGKAELIGPAKRGTGISSETRVVSGSAAAPSGGLSLASDAAIEYNEPGGSRMLQNGL